MIRSLYTAVSGMITLEQKQNVINNNLANANTVGFKSDNLAIRKFNDELIQNYDKKVGNKNLPNIIGSLSMGSRVDAVDTNFTQGMLQDTEKATDFAIEGRGFFTVQRAGENYYTRDGHFHSNIRGQLVTDTGDLVLGRNLQNNSIEPIEVGNGKIVVEANGNISINGNLKYKFLTNDFADYSSLDKVGDNLYSGTNPIEANGTIVRQNKLEKSNVNVVSEMVNMMTNMRSFESNQKMVQSIDETLAKLINEAGSVR